MGQLNALNNQIDSGIERWVVNAWKTYWYLKEVLKRKYYNAAKKCSTCLSPILTYGYQRSGQTHKKNQKLITCQRAMERNILGYTKRDRKRALDITHIMKIENIVVKIKNIKWM